MSKQTVAIIGMGIVGVSTALWLQRMGHKVVLIDKEGPAAGTSSGNGGVLASSGVVPVNAPGIIKNAPSMLINPDSPLFLRWRYLPKMLPWLLRYLKHANKRDTLKTVKALTAILHDSLEQHQELCKGTGAEKWLCPSDYIFVYQDRAAFNKDTYGWSMRREMGFKWDELEADELYDYDPIFQRSRNFAIKFSDHGHIKDPAQYVSDLAKHTQCEGAEHMIAEVTDITTQSGSRCSVQTTQGSVDCDAVVLAAGVWSKPLAEKLGIKTPMETERGYHIELTNPSVMPKYPMMLTSGKFVITPMDGRIRCAGIVEFGGLDTPQSKAPIDLLKKQIHEAFPRLTYDRVDEWMGHRPAPTDSIPFIGPVKNKPGIYAAFGHHHIGLTAGPKTGRLIAEMISNQKIDINIEPYNVLRFST